MFLEKIKKIKLPEFKEGKPNFWAIFIVVLVIIVFINTSAPADFPVGKMVTIEKGQTIKNTAEILKKENIIRSELFFNLFISFSDSHVVEGTYLFHKSEDLLKIIKKVTTGNYEVPLVKITFLEGDTSYEMAEKLKEKIPNFDVNTFEKLALKNEGYLFPDTYEFNQIISAEEVINDMRENFDTQIEKIYDEIEKSNRSLDEIIKMASIIEGEATRDSMQEVSNILWKRYDMNMPLQVDATFVYSIGKSTFDLTLSDLKDENNPYNSYKFVGLPPTPINNPGLKTIRVAANQQETPYLYFLTGRDGRMHYASNFEGHKNNRALYLD